MNKQHFVPKFGKQIVLKIQTATKANKGGILCLMGSGKASRANI